MALRQNLRSFKWHLLHPDGRLPRAIADRKEAWAYGGRPPSDAGYDPSRYLGVDGFPAFDFFLERRMPEATPAASVPRRIFVTWAGPEMSPARRASMEQLRTLHGTDAEIVLVTPETLDEWTVPEHPIPEAFHRLSTNHQSDYLRSYLLHHHGGGYSDVKQAQHAWGPCFDTIDADPAIWIVGYPEYSRAHIAALETRAGADLRHRFAHVAGNGAFIARAGTPFTTLWLDEVDARLRYFDAALQRHPATDPFGRNDGYPVPWSCLQGQVFQPLQLKFGDHVTLDPRLRPVIGGHR